MQSSKPRGYPRPVMATPDRRTTSSPAPKQQSSFQTPPPASSPAPVRYLDIRLAVPADCSPNQVADYLAKNAASAMTVSSPLTVASSSYESPTHPSRSVSPYEFIPISDVSSPLPPRASPFSPLSSVYSKNTAETAESSLATALRAASPGVVASLAPPLYQSPRSHTKSPLSSSSRSKSPFLLAQQQEDEDSVVKKTRIKTELCMHYANGRPCPFGAHCTYAHGEEELQMTKLLDLHDAGLIDVGTYRTRPCWTFVATGSCPFGKRCTGIHDPRVQGAFASWLTHTETQGNNSATDINVDAFHQKMHLEIHCGTPFGDQFLPEVDTWNELYKRVGNIFYGKNNKDKTTSNKKSSSSSSTTNNKSWVDSTSRPHQSLPAMVKLQIAIYMRGEADFSFKYCPQHIIHGELCMVLQKRPFRIVGNGAKQRVMGISHRQYNPKSPKDIMVHELAFGPDADAAARPVALWFNLDAHEIVECTAAQAKRFRYKRGLKNSSEKRRSPFDHLDHFQMIRPHDKDAFHLATDILTNRLAMLQAEHIVNLKDRTEQIARVRHEKEQLHARFDALLRYWLEFGWPVNKGRAKVDKKTPVPPVDGKYELPMDSLARVDEDAQWTPCELIEEDETVVMGQHTHRLWRSFTQCELIGTSQAAQSPSKVTPYRRLSVFAKLAEGTEIAVDRSLPHIYRDSPYYGKENQGPPDRQSERCWKALLLPPDQLFFENEWDIVREHFENSRSKKVLSIIQQK